MNLFEIIKNKLPLLISLFRSSSKSNLKIQSSVSEGQKPIQINELKNVKLVKTISLGKSELYPKFSENLTESTDLTPRVIILNQNNIENFQPGYVFDSNILMHFEDYEDHEDYEDLLKNGHKLVNKLDNKPIYVLSASKNEFQNKKCPKNTFELNRDEHFTGKKRNFENILNKLPSSLKSNIYYVNITKCQEVIDLAKILLPDLRSWGLHKADSQFLSFSKLTKSTLITCDKDLITSCNRARCDVIDFACFSERILQPSPLTVRERNTRILRKVHPSIFESKNHRIRKSHYRRGGWN